MKLKKSMAKININEYILYCFGLVGITIYLLYGTTGDFNHKNYEPEILEYIHWLWGVILILPMELGCGKVMWHIFRKEDFQFNFLFSERHVYVKEK